MGQFRHALIAKRTVRYGLIYGEANPKCKRTVLLKTTSRNTLTRRELVNVNKTFLPRTSIF